MTFLSNLRSILRPKPAALPAAAPAQDWSQVYARDVHLRGWHNTPASELFTDFAVGPEDVVVDVGCGDGGHASFCARQGARVILADIDAESLATAVANVKAAGNGTCESHLTDGNPLPIASGTASKIICTEVIEHVDSPEILIAELARIGQPGARYLLACPDPRAEAIQRRIAHPSYFEKPNHVRILSPEDFTALVEGAGLVIEARHNYGFYGALWWIFFWACPKFEGTTYEHPLLENWARTWDTLLDMPGGAAIKNTLDDLIPKSQVIIARKPV
jgi:SAM-dependent methyltransferase